MIPPRRFSVDTPVDETWPNPRANMSKMTIVNFGTGSQELVPQLCSFLDSIIMEANTTLNGSGVLKIHLRDF